MINHKTIFWNQKSTDPLLLKAWDILKAYKKATGMQICITDHNHLSIPEIFDEISGEGNICLYCMKHQLDFNVNKNQDYFFHPCRKLHINGMKKANQTGGINCFSCALGFMFWSSPIYHNRKFIGTMTAGGILGINRKIAAERMELLGKGVDSKNDLLKSLLIFPQADEQDITALSEMLLVCAESVSGDSGEFHRTLKRRNEQKGNMEQVINKLKEKYPEDAQQPEYPIEKEKVFLDAVRLGDAEKGISLLYEILGIIVFTHPEHFKMIQFRILELAVLLSRMENIAESTGSAATLTTHQYLKSIEDAKTTEDLVDTIHQMTLYMASEAFSFQGIRHVSALKKADRYIQQNFTRKLSLEEIASASGLSAPYFSTIFKDEMGENLSSYLNRLRVEKACRLLAETNLNLCKIAGFCGFEDQGWFSKIFKVFTGKNPKEFRQEKRKA